VIRRYVILDAEAVKQRLLHYRTLVRGKLNQDFSTIATGVFQRNRAVSCRSTGLAVSASYNAAIDEQSAIATIEGCGQSNANRSLDDGSKFFGNGPGW
jgi:hypothetical protein